MTPRESYRDIDNKNVILHNTSSSLKTGMHGYVYVYVRAGFILVVRRPVRGNGGKVEKVEKVDVI